jgi:hypothetical protein
MIERDQMKALGDLAREQAERGAPDELARPFSPEELDRMTDGVAAAVAPRRKRVISLAAWRGRVVGLLLVAAASLFFLRGNPTKAGLPPYDLVVEGGAREERGGASEPAAVVRVERGGRLVLVARPRVPSRASVHAAAWIERAGALTRWNVPVRVSEEGALRIDAAGAALSDLSPGKAQLVLFLSGEQPLPVDGEAAARALAAKDAGVQVLVQWVDVVP